MTNSDSWHIGCVTFAVRVFCAIAVFWTVLFQARAESPVFAEFPFEFHDGFLWVQVNALQSSKPLNFLLDTGASVSVINLDTAHRLKLHLGSPVIVQGVESTTKGFWPEQLSAKVNDFTLQKSYLAVDLGKLGRACNCPVDGLIGADFFRDRIVEIDFAGHKIRLLKSAEEANGQTVVALRTRPCGMEVTVQINGNKPQWVRLDTGCASALQWVNAEVRPENCSGRIAVALSEFKISETKSAVRLGGIELQSIPTGLHSKEIFAGEAGLLGNGILSRFDTITIDGKSGHLLLSARHSAN